MRRRGGFFLGDHAAVDAGALAVVNEVGGGEEGAAAAGFPGEGVEEGGGGAFPVGSEDLDDGGFGGGAGAEFAEEAARAVEAELDAEELGGVEPVDGFLVVHEEIGRIGRIGRIFQEGMR